MRTQPKKNLTIPNRYNGRYGNAVRKGYQNRILEKAPVLPKPLEYDDIDKAVFDFVDTQIPIVIDGELIPTYTLYSNQRFSEYSQMWEHSDENGNLYLNFKTVNREMNPSFGGNQGSLWNIPGNREYTLLQRQVLDDNGTESYEIYTMRQPYAVDLKYTFGYVTATVDNLNKFNQRLNSVFKSRQCYIRPNGHYLPMVLDEVSDETSYSISDRKFYVQTATVKLMAYIIEPEDFSVRKYPKRVKILTEGDVTRKHVPCVDVEETENGSVNVDISFKPYHSKAEFTFDTDMTVEHIATSNARSIRIMVNDTLYYTDKAFSIKDGDAVTVKVVPVDVDKETIVRLIGVNRNVVYPKGYVPENVYDDRRHENIIIE